ncbi:MAG: MFS transporter [Ignavibacteriales bacterium]|jgi:dipeptide/tripeptide permease|nr:MAG: peptide MFS transporter [Ignavibacterium sp.]MDX9713340.1 MFS transporter [Ignavibacteriaceae bacterium]MEB2355094.1 MFS transporter [Ignavibacteriales bacterium]GIK21458.1 MAG: MFS transporter [Ignavibacteriota bacterium]
MTEQQAKKSVFKSFSLNYWIVIVMEFFERGSYYGMMSILSVYMTDQLEYTKESVGVIKSVIQPMLYILPILSGAIGDRFGYKRVLTFAFIFLGLGYFFTSQTTEYAMVFGSLIIMAIGAGAFKPMISGTIARETNESNSTLGFGIFYWSINLGAFLFPLILVPYIKNAFGWQYVMVASAIGTAAMLIPTFFIYKEPKRPESAKTLAEVLKGAALVLTDFRFIGLIVIYSGFWILYFQMFDSVLWYVQKYVDATSLNNFVNGLFNGIGVSLNWKFDVEHVTVINAGTIILLQIIVSNIVKHTKALPTMIAGIAMGTAGMAILAINTNIWIFMLGITIFSIGEMTAHPKFISYVGLIAPEDKKALYLGYSFLYGVLGSFIGGILGANLYVHFVDKLNQPATLWIVFSMIGVVTIIGLLLYNKFVSQHKPAQSS